MAVQRIVKRAEDALGVDQPVGHPRHVFGAKDFGMQPHVAVLGAFGLQHLEPGRIVGQRDAAHMVQPAGQAGDLLKLAVQLDRVALQRRHVGVAVQRMESPRRVPGRPRSQFGPFDEHHVGPAIFGQVEQDRTADDAAADDQNLHMRFHDGLPPGIEAARGRRWASVNGWRGGFSCRGATGACRLRPPRQASGARRGNSARTSAQTGRWSDARRLSGVLRVPASRRCMFGVSAIRSSAATGRPAG